MKLRTLVIAFVLVVGLTSMSSAGMNRQRRAGSGLGKAQATSQQTCINEGTQMQRRNGQMGNGQNCLRQGRNGQGRNGQGGNGKGRNGQGGNSQRHRGQNANKQVCNCDGTCINQ